MAGTGRAVWIATVVSMALMASRAADATGMKDCSLKYKAAKTAGTLNGEDWKTFRATQCGTATTGASTPAASATTTAATVPAATASAVPAATASAGHTAASASATPAAAAKPTTSTASGHAPAASGSATFPAALDPKYAKLSPGKARMKTCLDQYHANKGSGGNGGLNWIAKGGYYSQCNTRLKGA